MSERSIAVMKCLDESTVKELAAFVAGNLVMVLEDDGDCWWCPADAGDHSGEVIYTNEAVFKEGERLGDVSQMLEDFFGTDIDLREICQHAVTEQMFRPSVALYALEIILKMEGEHMLQELAREHIEAAVAGVLKA